MAEHLKERFGHQEAGRLTASLIDIAKMRHPVMATVGFPEESEKKVG